MTLLCKTTIGSNNWNGAKSQASTFGSNLGGSGRLLTKAEAEGVAVKYRDIGIHYWLNDYYGYANGSKCAWYVDYDKFINYFYIDRSSGTGPLYVRPVVVISKSKL